MLFPLPAVGLKEQRDERRRSIEERCAKVAELVNHTGEPFVSWCDLNDEGDMLERMLPDAIQVSGKDSDDAKEEKLMAFIDGKARGLITKAKIAGWGSNWQHCRHMTDFPSLSFEAFYQKVRRFYRFGQKRTVRVDLVTTEGQCRVLTNMQRKSDQADEMFARMIGEMNAAIAIERANNMTKQTEVPAWLS
jgi:hypothetical protein